MPDHLETFDEGLSPIFTLDHRMVAAALTENGDTLDSPEDADAFWSWLENADDDLEELISMARQIIIGQYEAWHDAGRPR